ncbi:MAG: hypothetical protein RDA78_15390 [Roseibium sp.]|uniref:hypothetical protein n=1 Tax=Roseibium sp. TaxID=1936156 RepID=UPI003D9C3F81
MSALRLLSLFAILIGLTAMSPQDLPPTLIGELKKYNIAFTNDLFARDWTGNVEIYQPGKLFWVVDPASSESRVFASAGNGVWKPLNRPPDTAMLNRDLIKPDLAAPETPEIVTQRLTALLFDPRVILCEPGFAGWSDKILQTYLVAGGQPLETLRTVCQVQPTLMTRDNQWIARARVMDWRGAIVDVEFTGSIDPFLVENTSAVETMPAGSFNFAEEF